MSLRFPILELLGATQDAFELIWQPKSPNMRLDCDQDCTGVAGTLQKISDDDQGTTVCALENL